MSNISGVIRNTEVSTISNSFICIKQNLIKCSWSPDGKMIAAGSADRYILSYFYIKSYLPITEAFILKKCSYHTGLYIRELSMFECHYSRDGHVKAMSMLERSIVERVY